MSHHWVFFLHLSWKNILANICDAHSTNKWWWPREIMYFCFITNSSWIIPYSDTFPGQILLVFIMGQTHLNTPHQTQETSKLILQFGKTCPKEAVRSELLSVHQKVINLCSKWLKDSMQWGKEEYIGIYLHICRNSYIQEYTVWGLKFLIHAISVLL